MHGQLARRLAHRGGTGNQDGNDHEEKGPYAAVVGARGAHAQPIGVADGPIHGGIKAGTFCATLGAPTLLDTIPAPRHDGLSSHPVDMVVERSVLITAGQGLAGPAATSRDTAAENIPASSSIT